MLAKKKRGPAPTGKGHQVVVRLHDPLMDPLDTWIAQQSDPKPSRPEAIRIALKDWLSGLGLLGGATIPEKIVKLEAKIAAIPELPGPSPKAALATMQRAYAENELAKLKNARTRIRRAPTSKPT